MGTLTVTPDPLVAGSPATVCVTGGSGGQVTVQISDGGTPPQTSSVVITLDDEGDGCAEWPVSSWAAAQFSLGDQRVTRFIVQP